MPDGVQDAVLLTAGVGDLDLVGEPELEADRTVLMGCDALRVGLGVTDVRVMEVDRLCDPERLCDGVGVTDIEGGVRVRWGDLDVVLLKDMVEEML